jgi:hypothetical protein
VRFMLTWRTRPGFYKAAFQQFLETGGPPPREWNRLLGITCRARFWAGTSWKRTI